MTLRFISDKISTSNYERVTGEEYKHLDVEIYLEACQVGEILRDN
jgi:hypothetical protein